MCCFFAALMMLGPRAAILIWWLLEPTRWQLAFSSFWASLLGFLFLPWTTLMYVTVAPGGLEGFDWIIVGLGVLFDIGSYTSSAYGRRERYGTQPI